MMNSERILPRPIIEEVSVIIPTLGRSLLEGCLRSIACAEAWPAALIVVDQSSSPQVAAWLRYLQSCGMSTLYLPSSRRGIPAAMNTGLGEARTPYIAVTHDDCLVSSDWLGNMISRLDQTPGWVVTGRVEPGGEGVVFSIQTSQVPVVYDRPRLKEDILFPNNMGFSLATAGKIGPFDENPLFNLAAEDNDWAYRALRSGISIVYAPEVVVVHLDWRDRVGRLATYRSYARGQGAFYGKYIRNLDGFMALRATRDLLRSLWRWKRGILQNDQDLIDSGRTCLLNLILGMIEGMKSSRKR